MGFFSGILGSVGKVLPAIGTAVGGMFGGPAGAAIGGGIGGMLGDVGSSYQDGRTMQGQNQFNSLEAQKARDFNAEQALMNRDFNSAEAYKAREYDYWQTIRANEFSERMANTQFQRGIKDMRAAGINPMVAFSQGGAAAPTGQNSSGPAASGSAATASAASASQTRFPTDSATSAMQAVRLGVEAKRIAAETDNIAADTENKRATAANIEADTSLKTRQAYQANTQGNLNQASEADTLARVNRTRAETDTSLATAENIRAMNLAIKDLSTNPATRPFAAILQLLLKR